MNNQSSRFITKEAERWCRVVLIMATTFIRMDQSSVVVMFHEESSNRQISKIKARNFCSRLQIAHDVIGEGSV